MDVSGPIRKGEASWPLTWNRQANDAKAMRGILSGRERSFRLTLGGRPVGEMEWHA